MDINVKLLLNTPVWQMTGEQQYRLIQYALGNGSANNGVNTAMETNTPFAPKRTRIAGSMHSPFIWSAATAWFTNYGVKASWMMPLFRVSVKKSFSTERSHADVQTSTRNNNVPCVLITDNSKYDGREHHHY